MNGHGSHEAISTYTKDRRYRLLDTCENGAAIIGADSPGSLLGKTERDLFPEALADNYLEHQRRAFSDPSHTCATWVITPRGWEYWMNSFTVDNELLFGKTTNISNSVQGYGFVKGIDIENQCLHVGDPGTIYQGCHSRFELEIIRRYMLGYPLSQIAIDLHRSRDTIKYHLAKFRRNAEALYPTMPFNESMIASGLGHFLLCRELSEWFLDD